MVRHVAIVLLSALPIGGSICGDDQSGSESPEAAVEAFLEHFEKRPPRPRADGQVRQAELVERWRRICQSVDPEIHHLRFYGNEKSADTVADCGAAVTTLTAYTGDTSGMVSPTTIAGDVRHAETSGDFSIVTVELEYGSGPDTPAELRPPAEAETNVLVVRRSGRWWVATPQAFNPVAIRDGEPTPAQLQEQHRELLEAPPD